MSTTSTERKRGRPAQWGERTQVLIRVAPDLRDHLVTRARDLGYKTLSDYAWTLLSEGSGYDGEVPTPSPVYGKAPAGSAVQATADGYVPGLAPYATRVQVAVRLTADMHTFLQEKAVRLGFESLSGYAWALLNEESGFDGAAPQPRVDVRKGYQMTA